MKEKDYIVIAKGLRTSIEKDISLEDNKILFKNIVFRIIQELKADNPKFDSEKFYDYIFAPETKVGKKTKK